jgi:hypothetical protein
LAGGQIEALVGWIKLTGDAMLLAAASDTPAERLMAIQHKRVALHTIAVALQGIKTSLQKGGMNNGTEQR